MNNAKPLKIAITGAAGNIGYALAFRIASGAMLGSRPVILNLIEVKQAEKRLDGVMMELDDCAFPLLNGCLGTSDTEEGMEDVDIAILVGSKPRGAGMERKDLLKDNGEIFKRQGQILNAVASRKVKVLVVGNPANTNALIAYRNAPDLNPNQFSCMTRLDHNRALTMIAKKYNKAVEQVRKMIIWGNHSATQFPDPLHCEIDAQGHCAGSRLGGAGICPCSAATRCKGYRSTRRIIGRLCGKRNRRSYTRLDFRYYGKRLG